MGKRTVYRYDDEHYDVGSTISSRGDHLGTLTPDEKIVEKMIRAKLNDGERIRAESLYAWDSVDVAKRLHKYARKKFLYQLEIDDSDIRHRGDVEHFSDAVDAIKTNRNADSSVASYCRSDLKNSPKVELLVSRAVVIAVLDPKSADG